MAARLRGFPDWVFLNATGTGPNSSGKVYFYSPGTTTEKNIYNGTDGQTTLSNPITLTSAGRVSDPVFADGLYDVVVKDSADATIDTIST
jgi:hypothetical protein